MIRRFDHDMTMRSRTGLASTPSAVTVGSAPARARRMQRGAHTAEVRPLWSACKARRPATTVTYVQASETAPTAADPLPPDERREVVRRVLEWYRSNARDLPWRRAEATPWQVMVSEFMLQQTPVARVREPWRLWIERWPTPSALAADTSRRSRSGVGPARLPPSSAAVARRRFGDHESVRRQCSC